MSKRLKRTLALGTAGLCCMLNPRSTLADTAEMAMVTTKQVHEQADEEAAPPSEEKNFKKIHEFVKLSGLIEVDAIVARDYAGTDTNSFELATVELALEAKANSWVSNLADAEGIVDVLDEAGIDTVSSRVSGLSLHLCTAYGPFSLIGEYTMAQDSFDPDQLAFGDDGAQPAAIITRG